MLYVGNYSVMEVTLQTKSQAKCLTEWTDKTYMKCSRCVSIVPHEGAYIPQKAELGGHLAHRQRVEVARNTLVLPFLSQLRA